CAGPAPGNPFAYGYAVNNNTDAQQTFFSSAVEALTAQPPVQTSPSGWEAGGPIRGSSSFVWDTVLEPGGLPPGTSVTGFGFASDGLPTTVRFLAWGDVQLPSFPEGGAPESC